MFDSFKIEEGITEIGADAFSYCSALEMIEIPESVIKIGGNAFEYCYSLSLVNIDDGCKEIGDGSFEYCRSLMDANIPESVEEIADSAFDYCGEDFKIHTPKGSYAESFAIKKGLPYDNTYAVYTERTKISGKKIIAGQYKDETFSTFAIEQGIAEIETSAFYSCHHLCKIDIPASVKRVGVSAFSQCSELTFVNIGDGCEEIAACAFSECYALTDINIPASVKKISSSALESSDHKLTIHAPKGSYAESFAIDKKIPYDNNFVS